LGQFDLATRMNSTIMVEKSGFENLVPPQRRHFQHNARVVVWLV
jgi:hypothetical protein